jgi:hypothetical protein
MTHVNLVDGHEMMRKAIEMTYLLNRIHHHTLTKAEMFRAIWGGEGETTKGGS